MKKSIQLGLHEVTELQGYVVLKHELQHLKRAVSDKQVRLATATGFFGIALTCGVSLLDANFGKPTWRTALYLIFGLVAISTAIQSVIGWLRSASELKLLFSEIESRTIFPSGDETAGVVSESTLDSLPSETRPKGE